MKVSRLEFEHIKTSVKDQFALDVLMGFCASSKTLSPKYFYDDKGSDLFQKITQHADYYPTRTEFEILKNMKSELAKSITDDEIDIIELGVGDGHKSQLILDSMLEAGKKVNFYPIDISEEAMVQLENTINDHENLTIHGVVSEYIPALSFLSTKSKNRKLVLFLGSNIGNFDHIQSQVFLRQLWKNLNHDDYALIGFDLKKDIEVLTAAYNDSSGYTREFNLNLLTRINRELGANFDISKFQHLGVYNPLLGAMESYLLPREEQTVYVEELKRSFHFKAYESLHLEYSFKFLKSDIEFLCDHTGFSKVNHFTDKNEYFVDSLWKVCKES